MTTQTDGNTLIFEQREEDVVTPMRWVATSVNLDTFARELAAQKGQ